MPAAGWEDQSSPRRTLETPETHHPGPRRGREAPGRKRKRNEKDGGQGGEGRGEQEPQATRFLCAVLCVKNPHPRLICTSQPPGMQRKLRRQKRCMVPEATQALRAELGLELWKM